jgi:hypothetical protein
MTNDDAAEAADPTAEEFEAEMQRLEALMHPAVDLIVTMPDGAIRRAFEVTPASRGTTA